MDEGQSVLYIQLIGVRYVDNKTKISHSIPIPGCIS
jgi:hypothetical protein